MSKEGEAEPRSGRPPLPCLSSHISTELGSISEEEAAESRSKLQGSHKRMANVVAWEIQALAKEFGLEKLGFLTLTFPPGKAQHDLREAQRRFNSLNTHVLKGRYRRAIGVWERSPRGLIHFHLLVVLNVDIRTGFDFEAASNEALPVRERYKSACKSLKMEWRFWHRIASRYGFGRHELLPIRSTVEGIRRYIGKYVGKHINQREKRDIGAKVVRFIGYARGARRYHAQFAWRTPNAIIWRRKVAAFAKSVHADDMDQLKEMFGPRWCYAFAPTIMAMEVDHFVDMATLEEAQRISDSDYHRKFTVESALRDYQRLREKPPGRVYVLRC